MLREVIEDDVKAFKHFYQGYVAIVGPSKMFFRDNQKKYINSWIIERMTEHGSQNFEIHKVKKPAHLSEYVILERDVKIV